MQMQSSYSLNYGLQILLLIGLTTTNLSSSSALNCNRANFCSPSEMKQLSEIHYHYSTVIRNARIIDGTGSPATIGDFAIINDRIEAIGKVNESLVHPTETAVVEAKGNYLTPITAHMYPYLGGSLLILELLPPSVLAEGIEGFLDELEDPDYIMSLRNLIEFGEDDEDGGSSAWESTIALVGYKNVAVGSVVTDELKMFEGLTIVEGASLLKISDFDFLLYLIIVDNGETNIIIDSKELHAQPPHQLATTGKKLTKHPILEVEEAVRQVTGLLTQERFGTHGHNRRHRRTLEVGHKADLILFDKTFLNMAAKETPSQVKATHTGTRTDTGIVGVWLNGIKVPEDGTATVTTPVEITFSERDNNNYSRNSRANIDDRTLPTI